MSGNLLSGSGLTTFLRGQVMILPNDGSFTWADAEKAAILSQAAVNPSAAGKLYQATCDLIVAPISPNGSTQFGDLTLPAWSAYSAQTITWTAGQVTSTGLAEMDGDSVAFTLPSGAIGQTIYGY